MLCLTKHGIFELKMNVSNKYMKCLLNCCSIK